MTGHANFSSSNKPLQHSVQLIRSLCVVQELQVHRTWDVAAHPEWLVFEAEGQLQIRPAQHKVAQLLMADPGAIEQLNMGEVGHMGQT